MLPVSVTAKEPRDFQRVALTPWGFSSDTREARTSLHAMAIFYHSAKNSAHHRYMVWFIEEKETIKHRHVYTSSRTKRVLEKEISNLHSSAGGGGDAVSIADATAHWMCPLPACTLPSLLQWQVAQAAYSIWHIAALAILTMLSPPGYATESGSFMTANTIAGLMYSCCSLCSNLSRKKAWLHTLFILRCLLKRNLLLAPWLPCLGKDIIFFQMITSWCDFSPGACGTCACKKCSFQREGQTSWLSVCDKKESSGTNGGKDEGQLLQVTRRGDCHGWKIWGDIKVRIDLTHLPFILMGFGWRPPSWVHP